MAVVAMIGIKSNAEEALQGGDPAMVPAQDVIVDTSNASGAIPVEAVPSPSPQKKSAGIAAKIKNEGALVYDKPDFDGEVLATLPLGTKVRVSKGVTGNFAKFHRVRAGKILGYISTMDVDVEGGTTISEISDGTRKPKPNVKATKKKPKAQASQKPTKKKKRRESRPIYFSRFVGALIGRTEFKEGIIGADASTNLTIYGLKITGPDTIIEGPITDFNVALHYGAPDYYDRLSKTKPSGFVVFADLDLLIPFTQKQNQMAYFGLGPLLVLSSFKVTSGGAAMDLTTLNLGLSLVLGGAVRFDQVAFRLEGKYFIEKQSYRALQASVQTEF
jgi:hypothetical protein